MTRKALRGVFRAVGFEAAGPAKLGSEESTIHGNESQSDGTPDFVASINSR